MAETEQGVVIGVFEDRKAVIRTIDMLLKAGFHEDQLGFAARGHEEHIRHIHKQASTPNSVLRGVVGGLLGVADMLLVPITGPSDAAGMLAAVLPVTEEAIDHLPYPGSHRDKPTPIASKTATTTPEQTTPSASSTASVQPAQTQEQVSIASIEQSTSISSVTGAAATPAAQRATESSERTSIVTGSVIGGVLGAAVAFLLPGIGPVVAGGVLAEIFGGLAIGGIASGFLGAFTSIGVPEEQARSYEKEIKAGRTILAIHTTTRRQEVTDILSQNGAYNIQVHIDRTPH